MRAAAMSVWVFINLLFFGMCGYLYLIWSQYWMYIEKQRLFSNTSPVNSQGSLAGISLQETYKKYNTVVISNGRNNTVLVESVRKRSAIGPLWNGSKVVKVNISGGQERPSSNIVHKPYGRPRFPNIHKPILEFDSEKFICDDYASPVCAAQTAEFKELVTKEFHRVLMADSRVFKSGLDAHNIYDVKYQGHGKVMTKVEAICALEKVNVRTVMPDDEPFRSLGFNIPQGALRDGQRYTTCAVVTSAGALLGSQLGEFIDSHDMVLRFNNAPTENFTDDVGSKTTFRVLNSQVVTKPEMNFLENPIFKNVSIIIWDPSNFTSTLEDWYQTPDFPFFLVYKRLLEQRPGADVHLLKPEVLWELWSVLQDSTPYRLRRNPPSSGFIGLWFAMHRCQRVRVFEYVPSARATRRCHYYSPRNDTYCTLGAWHPLAQEKALAERIRDNSDLDVFQRGFIDIPGLRDVVCSN